MAAKISLFLSLVALILSGFSLFLAMKQPADMTSHTERRLSALERDVDELFSKTDSEKNSSNSIQKTLAFSVLRNELNTLKKEIADLRTGIVGGTAQKRAIADICSERQATLWKDAASTMSNQLMNAFTTGMDSLPSVDDDAKEIIEKAYSVMMQNTISNQTAWMKGEIDAKEMSERIKDSAQEFKATVEQLAPEQAGKILMIAFPTPESRAALQ